MIHDTHVCTHCSTIILEVCSVRVVVLVKKHSLSRTSGVRSVLLCVGKVQRHLSADPKKIVFSFES
jgi:hypothetical protein